MASEQVVKVDEVDHVVVTAVNSEVVFPLVDTARDDESASSIRKWFAQPRNKRKILALTISMLMLLGFVTEVSSFVVDYHPSAPIQKAETVIVNSTRRARRKTTTTPIDNGRVG